MDEGIIAQHKPAKLLVIDSSEGARALLKRRLSMYGHEVSTTSNKAEAIKVLNNRPVDAIFLNMFIDGENSYEFLTHLKEDKLYKSIPVIMISSNDDTELLVKCIEAGAEDYLVKPLNQTILKARLANSIARKEAHDKELAYLEKIKQGQKQIAAQEKMASVGVLVSSISQELKNPLNFIINFAGVSADICNELLNKFEENKIFTDDPQKEIKESLQKFQSNVSKVLEYGKSADQIMRFMLDQANIDNNKKSPANVNKIITQTIDMLFSAYKSKGITNFPKISTNLDENIPHIIMSVQSFSKVIYNVLDNALYAVMNKFEDLSSAQISITTKNLSEDIGIDIRDNGIGMSEEVQNRIFEPFFTTKEGGMNPGLGLSTVLEIIRDLKGSIVVDSSEGNYSEFKITLPKQ